MPQEPTRGTKHRDIVSGEHLTPDPTLFDRIERRRQLNKLMMAFTSYAI